MVDGQVWVRMGRRLGCVSRPQAGGRGHPPPRDPTQKKEGRGQPQSGAAASSQRIGQKPAGVIESELGGEDRRPILGLGRPTQQPAGRSLGEAVAEADDQPEHHRGTPHRRAPRARLARWRPPLSGRDAPARCRLPRPRRDPGRGQGRDPHRDTLLRLFPRPHPGGSRPGDPRPLGDREPPATSVLDVTFADDLSRLRKEHGARTMATVRHFALNLVRTATDKRSSKCRRKIAGWDPGYLEALISSRPA